MHNTVTTILDESVKTSWTAPKSNLKKISVILSTLRNPADNLFYILVLVDGHNLNHVAGLTKMILILLSNCSPRHSSAVVSFNQCFSFWIGKLKNLKKRINTAIICPVYYLLSLSPFACKTTTMHTTAQTFSSNIFKHFWKGLLHN